MVQLVEFEPATETLVRFVEETDPAAIVDATVGRLRDGADAGALIAAAGLAVSRATELPPGHHGGPVHPVSGMHALGRLTARLVGDGALMPAVQSVALANKHIHDPNMGPGAMPALDPGSLASAGKQSLLDGLAEALRARRAAAAERHLVPLLEVATPGEIMEVLLEIMLRRNALDDHYFLYPIFAFRGLDELGWQHAATLLRPPLRFLSRHPELDMDPEYMEFYQAGFDLYNDPQALDRLVSERGIDIAAITLDAEGDETVAVGTLGERIGATDRICDVADRLLEGLAAGLSLQGAGEALSIGGARLFLRSCSGNPFDVHIHSGINARRYLLGLDGLSAKSKLLALLSWPMGLEVRYLDESLIWPLEPDAKRAGRLAGAHRGGAARSDCREHLLAAGARSARDRGEDRPAGGPGDGPREHCTGSAVRGGWLRRGGAFSPRRRAGMSRRPV